MAEPAPLSIGMCAQAACVFDVMIYKPGNVHFFVGFEQLTALDFLLSAAAIAPVMEQAPFRAVGDTIFDSIRATRRVVNTNTNLGIVLLLAPLASVPPNLDLRGGVMRTLMRLTVDDARKAYGAIRLAEPGGLGTVNEQDISHEPTVTLREAMGLAAERDMIARQYVNDFEQVFEGAELLRQHITPQDISLQEPVARVFLQLLAKYPDSLIERKYGRDVAREVSKRARETAESKHDIMAFDAWLRSGRANPFPNPLNPGTTADLVVAALFVALRRGIIPLPLARPS